MFSTPVIYYVKYNGGGVGGVGIVNCRWGKKIRGERTKGENCIFLGYKLKNFSGVLPPPPPCLPKNLARPDIR